MKSTSKKQQFWFWLILLSLTITVIFVLCESVIRFLEHQKYKEAAKLSTAEYNRQIFIDKRNAEPYVYDHRANITVTLPATALAGKRRFSTNSLGLRISKRTAESLRFDDSIILLGDSVVEAATVDDGETFASLLEDKTKKPVLNFGLGSSNTAHQYYLLREKYLPDFSTSLVLLAFSANDFEDAPYLRAFSDVFGNWEFFRNVELPGDKAIPNMKSSELPPPKVSLRNVLTRSRFLMFVKRETRNFLGKTKLAEIEALRPLLVMDRVSDVNDFQKSIVRHFLRQIRYFAEVNQAQLLVFYNPTKFEIEDGIAGLGKGDLLEEIVRSEGIGFLDIKGPLKLFWEQQNTKETWYVDPAHLNKLGNIYFSEAIYSELKRGNHL